MSAVEAERSLKLFGTDVRLLAGVPSSEGAAPAEAALDQAEAALRQVHDALTRFEQSSDLSRLNRDDHEVVPASQLLRSAVSSALEAAALTGGLVDPVLEEQMHEVGYAHSRAGLEPAELGAALDEAPERRSASPNPSSPWHEIEVDDQAGTIARPVGSRLDLGGTGKGFAADVVASVLDGRTSWCADIGGDLRLGGSAGLGRSVLVTNPFSDRPDLECDFAAGAVATSGISRRIWHSERGFEHHMLDPATGLPAWTGVVQATAVAGSGVEAEALAKAALLSGPERAGELLAVNGGIVVLDSGRAEVVGPLAGRVREVVAA